MALPVRLLAPSSIPCNKIEARTMRQGPQHRRSSRPRELPTFYYHTHFTEMLEFVEAQYAHVLSPSQRVFRREFDALGFPAQCLYVRMVNRRGRLFTRKRLRYPEIADIDAAIEELDAARFLDRPTPGCVDDLLALMTRAQLVDALRPRLDGIRASMKKADLLAIARSRASRHELFAWLPTDGLVAQGRADDARFLLFLFFGRVQDGLTQFTMRDLGLVRAQEPGERRVACVALGLLRSDEANAILLEMLASGLSSDARDALEGLAAQRHDEALRAEVERAVDARRDRALSEAFEDRFGY